MKEFFYIPETLNPTDLLLFVRRYRKECPEKYLDRMYYLIDNLYLKRVIYDCEATEYFPINHELLVKVLTVKWAGFAKFILKEYGLIEEEPSNDNKANYCRGVSSKCFRIAEPFANAKFRRVPIEDKKLVDRTEEQAREKTEAIITGHDGIAFIHKSLNCLTFDTEGAWRAINGTNYETATQRHRREIAINGFADTKHLSRPDPTSRLYHHFSQCPRDMRKFATYKGQPLISVDISDCQPALHAILYPDNSIEKKIYVEIVASGTFKAFLNSKLVKPFDLSNPEQKEIFKEELFHHVFYGCNYAKCDSEIAKVFSQQFPQLAKLIRERKTYNNKDLPVSMQRLEAGVVIDKVVPLLIEIHKGEEDFFLLSIHDCLVTTAPFVEKVKQALVDGFRELLGFEVAVKVATITKEELPSNESAFPA